MLERDERIFVEGQPIDSLHVLLVGELRVTKQTDAGEAVMAVHRPGEFTGESSLLTGGLSPVTGYATCRTSGP